MKRLIVVGDSDIAYWPKALLPSLAAAHADVGVGASAGAGKIDDDDETDEWLPALVSGHSGALLAEVVPHLQKALEESSLLLSQTHGGNTVRGGGTKPNARDALVIVACAGENDIGEGLSLEKSAEALQEFVDVVYLEQSYTYTNESRYLFFLGPKFEPWLEHDPSYKKQYNNMAIAFQRCLQEYEIPTGSSDNKKNNSDDGNDHGQILFIDCLTMFCGDTANIPGARFGGRAKADPRFFASDQLHLSNEGYAVWKDVVEQKIRQFLAQSS